jgi:lipoprotein Spr
MADKLPGVPVELVMGLKKTFIALLVLTISVGCASHPRYTSSQVETRNQPASEDKGRGEKEPLSFRAESETEIDQTKMGRIIESYLGTTYKKGGADKKGMDCSGFVMKVYKEYAGFELPHDSRKLFKLVREVDKEKLRYGDLVFFSDSGILPSHVGIYSGERKFVHSTKGYGVIVSSLNEDRYRKSYMGARRVIP